MLSFQIQKNSVEFLRISRLYVSFRADDPDLAPYPTLDALLEALEVLGLPLCPPFYLTVEDFLAEHGAAAASAAFEELF